MRFQLLWPESKAVSAGCLQSDDDDARHHDDLLRGHADPGRSRQLHRAAPDRGARHGLSAAECPGPVGDAVRGHPGLFQLCHRRRARHWLVCLRPADRTHLRARPGHRLLDPRPPGERRGQRVGRHQPRHHGADAALPGHDPAQDPALHMDGVLGQRSDPLRLAAAHRRPDHAAVRPHSRCPLLRRAGGWLALPVAAPVLVLRPSRSVHPRAAGIRHGVRRDPGLLAQGDLRLRVRGRLHRGHRFHQLWRLGPPYVRRGDEPDRRYLLCRDEPGGRHPDRDQDCSTGWPRSTAAAGGWRLQCSFPSASCRCS